MKTKDEHADRRLAPVDWYVIEKDSLSETLLEIAAKHGNKAAIEIVAAYASHLTESGRDDLVKAIGECYSQTRFEDCSHTDQGEAQPPAKNL